jgi:hypothetical protein
VTVIASALRSDERACWSSSRFDHIGVRVQADLRRHRHLSLAGVAFVEPELDPRKRVIGIRAAAASRNEGRRVDFV